MTRYRGQRMTVTVRLLDQKSGAWRRSMISDGLAVVTGGRASVCFSDMAGSSHIEERLVVLRQLAGSDPLVVRLAPTDPLPTETYADVRIVRIARHQITQLGKALRDAALDDLRSRAAAARLRALTSLGHGFPIPSPSNSDKPAAILTEPSPEVLKLLTEAGWRDLVAPISSSHTLRLLEHNHASALIIHLRDGHEHRLPILKLIRRQTELRHLPVAVISTSWTDKDVKQWSDAGADLIATPHELPEVLLFLKGSAARFQVQRSLMSSLTSGTSTDHGAPAPVFGCGTFARIVSEHRTLRDAMAFGAIELHPDHNGGENELSEAGVYMTMALSPMEIVCRPKPNLFMIAMPHADRYYAGRVMRTMQTLVEDLKFGEEPHPVLISARHHYFEGHHHTYQEALRRLQKVLAEDQEPAILS